MKDNINKITRYYLFSYTYLVIISVYYFFMFFFFSKTSQTHMKPDAVFKTYMYINLLILCNLKAVTPVAPRSYDIWLCTDKFAWKSSSTESLISVKLVVKVSKCGNSLRLVHPGRQKAPHCLHIQRSGEGAITSKIQCLSRTFLCQCFKQRNAL